MHPQAEQRADLQTNRKMLLVWRKNRGLDPASALAKQR
jgi:hypothetical protein